MPSSVDVAGAALGFEGGADVLNFDVAGAGGGGDGGGFGEGDVVVDGDVAVEVVVVTFADGDVVAVLNDGRVVDDLLDAAVDVAASAHPAVAGADVGDDVNLIGGAGMEVNVAGAGGDGDVGRAADVEGAVEVAVGGEGGGGGEGEGAAVVARTLMVMGFSLGFDRFVGSYG